jgi:predicted naringenin-chalcone synthase
LSSKVSRTLRQRLGREQQKVRAVLPICGLHRRVLPAPSEEYSDGLTGHGSFGDGAAAVVVGAEPHPKLEKSLFEIQWAGTAVVPDSLEAIAGYPRETGTRSLNFRLFNHMLNCSLHIN